MCNPEVTIYDALQIFKEQTSTEATIVAVIIANASPGLNVGLPHWNG